MVVWTVRTIRDIGQEDMGREIARKFLDERKVVAGSSTAGFLSVIQNELQTNELQGNQGNPKHPENVDLQIHTTQDGETSSANSPDPVEPTPSHNQSNAVPVRLGHMNENILNPPQIQKVIVEHVIRNESAASSSSSTKIRTFSGRMPKPNGEVDYETWRTQVDLLLSNPSLNDAYKVRRIFESLLSPAANVVKPLGINSSPSAYVIQVESAFGVVEDGEELFAAFLSSNQNHGEKPSTYLTRIHSLLTRVISRGEASLVNSNEQLLRQFIRGCWDQSLIIGLQLDYKKSCCREML